MTNLLEYKWGKLKDEIELLKPYAATDADVIRKIRTLKNESHILYEAMYQLRNNVPQHCVLNNMRETRELYKQIWKMSK